METIPKNPFEEYPFYHNSKKLENKDVLINIENLEKEKLDELLRQAETRTTIMFSNFVFHIFKSRREKGIWKSKTIVGEIPTIDFTFFLFFAL